MIMPWMIYSSPTDIFIYCGIKQKRTHLHTSNFIICCQIWFKFGILIFISHYITYMQIHWENILRHMNHIPEILPYKMFIQNHMIFCFWNKSNTINIYMLKLNMESIFVTTKITLPCTKLSIYQRCFTHVY